MWYHLPNDCLSLNNVIIAENKISKGATLSWIFGVILVFFGFVGVMSSDFLPGLMLALMGAILIPPVGQFIENKWKFKLTTAKKVIFLVVGFFVFVFSIDSPDSSKTATQVASDQKPAVEVKTDSEVKAELPATTGAAQIEAPATEQGKTLYQVLKVVDGDTVAVQIDGKQEVLRLIGINTPETVDPRKPVQCFGTEASAKAKEILTGKQVSLEADDSQSDRDKYGRLLRYIYLEDGTNFNKLMIDEGYAYEYTYGTPYKYQADFKDAQQKAKESKKGLWAEDTCNGNLTKSNGATTQTTTVATPTEAKPATQNAGSFSGSCAGKRTCGQMTSCQEAYFYLNSCGVGSLDRDKDGIPCETLCN